MPSQCTLALDLGTSAFKCGLVRARELLAEPIELPYELDYNDGCVTVQDAEEYIHLALKALKLGVEQARKLDIRVGCIGICSQAQTFVGVDEFGISTTPAVVWLDIRAENEAEALGQNVHDFAARTGFPNPNPQMFLLKAIHDSHHSRVLRTCHRILLLNEFVIMRLTGMVYGDRTLQGMGGFYDISDNSWNEDYINLAGINGDQLAQTYPAGGFAQRMISEFADGLGLRGIPVYSCGNDQCCSAIGTGLNSPGDVVCNFGTAMVVYTVRPDQPRDIKEDQIAGIDPLTGGYFLLGYASDCGVMIDRIHQTLGADCSIDEMIRKPPSDDVRALLERLSGQFRRLLGGVVASPSEARLIASGGLSRSSAWLNYLGSAHGMRFEKAVHEHSSLIGIGRIIERHVNTANGA